MLPEFLPAPPSALVLPVTARCPRSGDLLSQMAATVPADGRAVTRTTSTATPSGGQQAFRYAPPMFSSLVPGHVATGLAVEQPSRVVSGNVFVSGTASPVNSPDVTVPITITILVSSVVDPVSVSEM